jgi:biotin operon repressor
MDYNMLLSISGPVLSTVIGWFMRELWSAVKELRKDLREIEKNLPAQYVLQSNYREDIRRVHDLLDKIYEKLESKADR